MPLRPTVCSIATLTALALFTLATTQAAQAQTNFAFSFDGTFDNTLTPPLVGTGTLSLASDPGDGTFLYTALAPTYTFTVGANTFTQADIASDPAQVRLILSTANNVRRVQFFDDNAAGTPGGGGPAAGSLDLVHNGVTLTFEPSFFGGSLDLYQVTQGTTALQKGTYLGLGAVPEPGSVALCVGLIVTGAGFVRRRARK